MSPPARIRHSTSLCLITVCLATGCLGHRWLAPNWQLPLTSTPNAPPAIAQAGLRPPSEQQTPETSRVAPHGDLAGTANGVSAAEDPALAPRAGSTPSGPSDADLQSMIAGYEEVAESAASRGPDVARLEVPAGALKIESRTDAYDTDAYDTDTVPAPPGTLTMETFAGETRGIADADAELVRFVAGAQPASGAATTPAANSIIASDEGPMVRFRDDATDVLPSPPLDWEAIPEPGDSGTARSDAGPADGGIPQPAAVASGLGVPSSPKSAGSVAPRDTAAKPTQSAASRGWTAATPPNARGTLPILGQATDGEMELVPLTSTDK